MIGPWFLTHLKDGKNYLSCNFNYLSFNYLIYVKDGEGNSGSIIANDLALSGVVSDY